MSRPLNVHMLPDLFREESIGGGIAVIIDILRASSTIVTAIHNGAEAVFPCATPDEARLREAVSGPEKVLLGGERGGVRIDGFDLGNSPAEYPGTLVRGRTLAFTTTNGTRALLKSLEAKKILIGCFLNRRSLLHHLVRDSFPIHLVCAGTDGQITGEDFLFAGCVVQGLVEQAKSDGEWELNDSAEIARRLWLTVSTDSMDLTGQIVEFFRTTRGGRNLIELQYDADLARCAQMDASTAVPEFDFEKRALFVGR
jgi:2-phosphosulfolactate phosphatase